MKIYNKFGKPISLEEWGKLRRNKTNYKRVSLTKLWWGGSVSTIWIGLDHSFTEGAKPLIFESAVFGRKSWHAIEMKRYSGLAEARNGHIAMVKEWSNSYGEGVE